MAFSPDYLAERLTPHLLPTKDGGYSAPSVMSAPTCLRSRPSASGVIIGKAAYRLLVHGAGAAAMTQQVQLALSRDGQLDVGAFER